jgi:putative sugar O-methyltransferase
MEENARKIERENFFRKNLNKLKYRNLYELYKIFLKRFLRILIKKYYNNIESYISGSYYLHIIEKATYNHKIFKNFKNHSFYNIVLEHVSYDEGKKYLDYIIKNDKNLLNKIDKFLENDKIGNPQKYYYKEIDKLISPTTLRYIKVGSDIEKIFSDKIDNIVEIGCGYGGQYLILDKLKNIQNYLLIDLFEVTKLIEKYLECFVLNSSYETKTINKISYNNSWDLVISNYAFSELPCETQLIYIKKILLNSKNGYMTMNSGLDNSTFGKNHLSLKQITNLMPNIKIISEEPLTSKNNYIIVWGNIKNNIN